MDTLLGFVYIICGAFFANLLRKINGEPMAIFIWILAVLLWPLVLLVLIFLLLGAILFGVEV